MKKIAIITVLLLSSFSIFSQNIPNFQRPNFLKKDSIKSSLDANVQVFYYYKSTKLKPKPFDKRRKQSTNIIYLKIIQNGY